MQTATVITHGSSQSVELPEGFHIDGNEVYVKHLGKSVLLIPKDADPWDLMADSLNQLLADTITLRDLYKKHHWQVAGHTFYQLHLLFDEIAAAAMARNWQGSMIVDTPAWKAAEQTEHK